MGENLDLHGRMAVRTPMQWHPAPVGGFSTVAEDVASWSGRFPGRPTRPTR